MTAKGGSGRWFVNTMETSGTSLITREPEVPEKLLFWSAYENLPPRERIRVLQFNGAQSHGPPSPRAPVESVANDGQPGFSEVNPDLVGSSRERSNFDKRRVETTFQHTEGSLGFPSIAPVDAHSSVLVRVLRERKTADPVLFPWRSAYDRQIAFGHLAGLEEFTHTPHRAGRFAKEQNAAGLRIQSMDIPQEPKIARTRPEGAGADGGLDSGLQITLGLLPGEGHQHPAGRLIHRQDDAILVKDRDSLLFATAFQLDVRRFGHEECYQSTTAVRSCRLASVGFPHRRALVRVQDMPSFDIVSRVNTMEIENAINQSRKELANRFDFKGSPAEISLGKSEIHLTAQDAFKIKALEEIVIGKLAKRSISLKSVERKEPEISPLGHARQTIIIKQGVDSVMARQISSFIRDLKLKVTVQIQADELRVTGKNRDDLQAVIAAVREHDFPVALSFTNFRD